MLYTYDPRSIIITFRRHPITGIAEDTFLTISRTEDTFIEKTGCSGETTRSKSNNRSGTARVVLMQSSPDNDFLSKCALLDENGNAGVGEFSAKDINGTSLFFSSQAYVKRPPESGFGKEVGNREWTIFCADLNIVVGGNVPQL